MVEASGGNRICVLSFEGIAMVAPPYAVRIMAMKRHPIIKKEKHDGIRE
jgi:hypothetical protein